MRLRSLAVGKIIWSTTAWFFVFFKLTICKIIWSIMIDWLIDRMRKTSRLAIGLGCHVTVWVSYRAGTDLIFFTVYRRSRTQFERFTASTIFIWMIDSNFTSPREYFVHSETIVLAWKQSLVLLINQKEFIMKRNMKLLTNNSM